MGEKELVIVEKSRKVEKKMTHRCNASTRRHAGNDETSTGFNFSVEFRRNFGVFFVFASYREEKFRYFSFSNLKIQKYL